MTEAKAKQEAERVWNKMLAFSSYGFNRSHSAAYSIMGYWSMWMKVKHPLAFWATALHFAHDKEIPYRLVELVRSKDISLTIPDINESFSYFAGNWQNNTIYWSLNKVKGLSSITSDKITSERAKNGPFKNLSDLVKRMNKSGLTKSQVHALILAGAFDNMYGVRRLSERYDIVKKHRAVIEDVVPEGLEEGIGDDNFWLLKQREVIGFGALDYNRLISAVDKDMLRGFITMQEFETMTITKKWGKDAVIAGSVIFYDEKTSKKGKWAMVRLMGHDGIVSVKYANEAWEEAKELVEESRSKGIQIAIRGNVIYDDWHHTNVMNCWRESLTIKIL